MRTGDKRLNALKHEPLINQDGKKSLDSDKTETNGFFSKSYTSTDWEIIQKFIQMASPSVLQQVFSFLPVLTNVVLGGHYENPAKLAAIGIGGTTVNILFVSLMYGLNGA